VSLIPIFVIVLVLVGVGIYARTYFMQAKLKEEDRETWKRHAINHNRKLDEALANRDDQAYAEYLHPRVSRFQPRIPYRIEGAAEVLKKVRSQMEQVGGTTSVMQSSAEVYSEVLLVTHNYMTEGKLGEKFVEGSGKVTRVWVHTSEGWKLVHEHTSEN